MLGNNHPMVGFFSEVLSTVKTCELMVSRSDIVCMLWSCYYSASLEGDSFPVGLLYHSSHAYCHALSNITYTTIFTFVWLHNWSSWSSNYYRESKNNVLNFIITVLDNR